MDGALATETDQTSRKPRKGPGDGRHRPGRALGATSRYGHRPLRTASQAGQLINPGDGWDLGHDEQRNYRGPEHQACNRATRGALREPRELHRPPPDPPTLVIPF